jgi:hypothetical protein
MALPTKAKDIIVFTFIIEYIVSLRDLFWALGNNYRSIIIFYMRIFLEDDILACVET